MRGNFKFQILNFKEKKLPTTNYSLQTNLGFSLLELLVVISVIAILVSIGLSSFSTAQKKARDSKRKNDVSDIQKALESFYSVCGFNYPTPTGSYAYSQGVICAAPSIGILPTVPKDPRNTPYYCSGSCNGSGYTICAVMEAETPTGYCLSNQQ